jgi:hypothetical protein
MVLTAHSGEIAYTVAEVATPSSPTLRHQRAQHIH